MVTKISEQTTLNFSLPRKLKVKAMKRAKQGHFSTTSDYLQNLIRKDIEEQRKWKNLHDFVQAGIDSSHHEVDLKKLDRELEDIIKKHEK